MEYPLLSKTSLSCICWFLKPFSIRGLWSPDRLLPHQPEVTAPESRTSFHQHRSGRPAGLPPLSSPLFTHLRAWFPGLDWATKQQLTRRKETGKVSFRANSDGFLWDKIPATDVSTNVSLCHHLAFFPSPFSLYLSVITLSLYHTHTTTHNHTDTHTQSQSHTQSHNHTQSQSHNHTQSHSHKHNHTQSHTHNHTVTHTQSRTQSHTQSHTHNHTVTNTVTHTITHTTTHIHNLTHIITHTQSHTHTHTHTHTITLQIFFPTALSKLPA